MDAESPNSSSPDPAKTSSNLDSPSSTLPKQNSSTHDTQPTVSTPALSSWARILNRHQPLAPGQQEESPAAKSTFARIAGGLGLNLPAKSSGPNEYDSGTSTPTAQPGVLESLTKGIVGSSVSAVKAVQVKARHIVSQNKRRYQEGGFDLDMTYITENIIAMGFPAGDMSSGFFGFVEGLYRNHMEEVIKFFETYHKGKYKVYNLCSERLYDASLFEGKEDILNVVVVHCKAGKARTGLMICSLLLFLKFFTTAEECIDYYNQKRCLDGKGLILPSQIRYVKYFESILTNFNGEIPPGRRCMLRGFRLHKCPYWTRPSITISNHNGILFSTSKHPKTKDLMPDDFWIRAPRKGMVVFALPGQPGLTELAGDFKIHFQDSHGDFYCWLNTTLMENRVILNPSDLDGFDKRKLPDPGFQVEIVMIDYDGSTPTKSRADTSSKNSDGRPGNNSTSGSKVAAYSNQSKVPENQDDDVFSDSDGEETAARTSSGAGGVTATPLRESGTKTEQIATVTHGPERLSVSSKVPQSNTSRDMNEQVVEKPSLLIPNLNSGDIKAIAADASVFSFGDDEDYESD